MHNFIKLVSVICLGVFLLSSTGNETQAAQRWLSEHWIYLAGSIFATASCVWVLFFGKSPNPTEQPETLREEAEVTATQPKARLHILKILSTRPDEEGEHHFEQIQTPTGGTAYEARTTEKNGNSRWWWIVPAKDIDQ